MVSDVMATPVVRVAPDTLFKRTVQVLQEYRVSAVPVVDPDGRLLGIVSETDLALKEEYQPGEPAHRLARRAERAQLAKARGTTAADFMSAPVVTVAPGASLPTAARLLHQGGVRHLPVVDHDGRVVGMITRRDLLQVFLVPDWVLAGEINTKVLHATFNVPADAVTVEVHDGVARLSGRVPWHSTADEIAERVRGVDGVVAVD
ncbi:MAG TPA: CBS domain-containing protein, partial [Actinomycetes bacterium]|nr:CBS domain-containing protein [Actinomycetes bacterium]